MGMCWYCHWGWAKPVAEIYLAAKTSLGDGYWALHYSASHIVWEDENFYTEQIQWCLDNFEEYRNDYSDNELATVRWSLEELLKIPENERCIEPEDWDDEHPELYPPSVEVVKV